MSELSSKIAWSMAWFVQSIAAGLTLIILCVYYANELRIEESEKTFLAWIIGQGSNRKNTQEFLKAVKSMNALEEL